MAQPPLVADRGVSMALPDSDDTDTDAAPAMASGVGAAGDSGFLGSSADCSDCMDADDWPPRKVVYIVKCTARTITPVFSRKQT